MTNKPGCLSSRMLLYALVLAVLLPARFAVGQGCPTADLNRDGKVSGADISVLLGQWGTNGGTTGADLNGSGVVDVPNACATLWLPTQIFDFDINPSAAGPTKHIDGSIQMPLSPDR